MSPDPARHANTAREPGPAASSADPAIAPARTSQGAAAWFAEKIQEHLTAGLAMTGGKRSLADQEAGT